MDSTNKRIILLSAASVVLVVLAATRHEQARQSSLREHVQSSGVINLARPQPSHSKSREGELRAGSDSPNSGRRAGESRPSVPQGLSYSSYSHYDVSDAGVGSRYPAEAAFARHFTAGEAAQAIASTIERLEDERRRVGGGDSLAIDRQIAALSATSVQLLEIRRRDPNVVVVVPRVLDSLLRLDDQ